MRRRLTADEWDDAADLFEQGATLAEMAVADNETHSAAACKYAVKRMNSLAMFATGKAISERERTQSSKPCPLPQGGREGKERG